jgi:hypothetical protein
MFARWNHFRSRPHCGNATGQGWGPESQIGDVAVGLLLPRSPLGSREDLSFRQGRPKATAERQVKAVALGPFCLGEERHRRTPDDENPPNGSIVVAACPYEGAPQNEHTAEITWKFPRPQSCRFAGWACLGVQGLQAFIPLPCDR